jgi:hypothetical protein
MRWITICSISLLWACAPPQGEDSAAPAAASSQNAPAGPGEWTTLFDGTDLGAFTMTGDANWSIEGDAVGADSGSGMLVTKETYSDFELEVEFFVSMDANSGIFLRCADPQDIADTTCYEANIYDTRPDQTYRTGGIVHVAEPAAIMYTGGRWNRYELMADGTHLRVVLNGEQLVDTEDGQYTQGHIGLQYGAGVVKFRNVRVRRL